MKHVDMDRRQKYWVKRFSNQLGCFGTYEAGRMTACDSNIKAAPFSKACQDCKAVKTTGVGVSSIDLDLILMVE